jgi:amidohydrolase
MDYKRLAEKTFAYAVELRRDFHRHPELGFEEKRSAAIIAERLVDLDFKVQSGIAHTGIAAELQCSQPGPVIMLRFDMDALQLTEETGAEYASSTPGLMHGCGHDGHMAVGLALAKIVSENREKLFGTVKFIFQPAEEGLGGAEKMLMEGVLAHPKPDVCLGLHIWNNFPVKWISVRPGPLFAGADVFKIRISGKGGHGGMPHQAIDPIPAVTNLVMALQTIVSRNVPADAPAVLSITQIHAGEAMNVIPSSAEIVGMLRWYDEEVRQLILDRIGSIANHAALAYGCQAVVEHIDLTPPVINDDIISNQLATKLTHEFPELTFDQTYRTTASEDMAFFMEQIPGCYILLGSANREKGLDFPHHHPRFDFDEVVLRNGIAVLLASLDELMR